MSKQPTQEIHSLLDEKFDKLSTEIAEAIKASYKAGRNDLVDWLLNGYDLVAKNDNPTFTETEERKRLSKTDVARLYAVINKKYLVDEQYFAQAFGTEANHGFKQAVYAARNNEIGDKSDLDRFKQIILSLFDLLPKNHQAEIIEELTPKKR